MVFYIYKIYSYYLCYFHFLFLPFILIFVSGHPTVMMMHAIENTVLHFSEALQLFQTMNKETNKTAAILLKILPLLQEPQDTKNMLLYASNGDRMQMCQLKQALGFAFGPLCGEYDGYYR